MHGGRVALMEGHVTLMEEGVALTEGDVMLTEGDVMLVGGRVMLACMHVSATHPSARATFTPTSVTHPSVSTGVHPPMHPWSQKGWGPLPYST